MIDEDLINAIFQGFSHESLCRLSNLFETYIFGRASNFCEMSWIAALCGNPVE